MIKTTKVTNNYEFEGRRLEEEWRPINIEYDFQNLQDLPDNYKSFLQDTVFPEIKVYMESTIGIKEAKKHKTFKNDCGFKEATFDPKYETQGTEADLVLIIGKEFSGNGTLAYAAPCHQDEDTKRPITGIVVINIDAIKLEKQNVRFTFEDVFHEIVHVLAFNSSLYDSFLNQPAYKHEVQILNGQQVQRYKIITPKVVALAKEYFNCSSIDGVYLENQGDEGSAGSHFETIHFGQEVMTPSRESFGLISKFTFAILEDSGWYKTDYSKADQFSFAKDSGCDFFKSTSCVQNVKELCNNEGTVKCSRNFQTKTYCEETSYSDGCIWSVPQYPYHCQNKLTFQQTSIDEQNGINSRCFETTSSGQDTAGCYKSSCSGGKIKLQVGDLEYECEKKGQILAVSKSLSITCPDIQEFCGYFEQQCKDDCNSNGFCTEDKSCHCLYFYKGDTCSETKSCDSNSNKMICETTEYTNFSSQGLLQLKIFTFFFGLLSF